MKCNWTITAETE